MGLQSTVDTAGPFRGVPDGPDQAHAPAGLRDHTGPRSSGAATAEK